MSEYTYVSQKKCPICQNEFEATQVKSRVPMRVQDTDFCTHFKDFNPYFYSVWVCNHCGYAGADSWFSEPGPAAVEKIRAFLAGRDVHLDLGGERTFEKAVNAYKMAIFYAELVKAPASRLGGLLLKLAWVYRLEGKQEEECGVLEKAVAAYEEALSKERMPIGNMTEVTLTYLVGELLRRLGNYQRAKLYFNQVISNPLARGERNVFKMTRDAWNEIREEEKRQKEEEEAQKTEHSCNT